MAGSNISANEKFGPTTMSPDMQAAYRAERVARAARDADTLKRMQAAKPKLVPGMKKGGSVGSASKRADGCAVKGKTRGKFV